MCIIDVFFSIVIQCFLASLCKFSMKYITVKGKTSYKGKIKGIKIKIYSSKGKGKKFSKRNSVFCYLIMDRQSV